RDALHRRLSRRATMQDGVVIRALQPGDLPAYKALRDAVLAAHPSAFTSDAAEAQARSAESYRSRLGLDRPEGGHFTLGAWIGAALVGAISCERETRAKGRHLSHVVGMMVRDEWQGRAIGRALLVACIAAARRADGLEMLTLSVTAGNAPAIRLYEAHGFTRYGSLPRAIRVDGRYFAKDLMALAL
ncbi:MAG TPA: GNAT family N-acetyltransferase, partial [Burkholderiaceae bacterium]|nr:GNAT family N-acetyltransferase [Burkholderiaceae bacterium]